jgi:hypothetical protein
VGISPAVWRTLGIIPASRRAMLNGPLIITQ